MLYIGIDVHKKNLSVCVLDESGKLVKRRKVCNQPESVVGLMGGLDLPAGVALGPTHNWGMLYDLFEQIRKQGLTPQHTTTAVTALKRRDIIVT